MWMMSSSFEVLLISYFTFQFAPINYLLSVTYTLALNNKKLIKFIQVAITESNPLCIFNEYIMLY